jgi:glycosyltransferase involved in cell wall biosynthesis
VLTLHEYLAICNHYGQMVTKQHRTLCHRASPLRCNSCFKDINPADFFLRTLYIQRFFELVDHFIAPSAFLAERYIAWGVPPAKISVIENIVYRSVKRGTDIADDRDGPLRVGFFGQVSELKGIGVLLEAAKFLEKQNEFGVVIEIFGDYSIQPMEFQQDFLTRLNSAGRNVVFHGPYDQDRVDDLMQSVDIVVMPSIWWENSPVVIQEALRNRRPILCSDIGGMAEKVRDGLDGFQFPVGNSVALASLLIKIAEKPTYLSDLDRTMRSPDRVEDAADRFEHLYASLCSTRELGTR